MTEYSFLGELSLKLEDIYCLGFLTCFVFIEYFASSFYYVRNKRITLKKKTVTECLGGGGGFMYFKCLNGYYVIIF